MRLAAYAGDRRLITKLSSGEISVRAGGGPPEQFPEDLAAEVASLPPSVHTVIFSNEHCHSRLVRVEMIRKLADLLSVHFDEIKVIFYLRRQDDLASSFYSTQIRNGETRGQVLPVLDKRLPYYDYASMVDRWGEVFGRSSLRPRLFGHAHFSGGDLIRDFLEVCGASSISVDAETPRNPSLLPAAQEFLRQYNETAAGQARPRPRWIYEFMKRTFAGPGRRASRADAEAFVSLYADGNEQIRAEFFPERGELFSGDFSSNPSSEPLIPGDEVLKVALAVIEYLEAKSG